MRKFYLLFFTVLLYQACLGQSVDATFQGAVTYTVPPDNAIYLPDGKYIIWNDEYASFIKVNGQTKRGIVRFNADGTIDNTFQSGAGVVGNGTVTSVARQSDGKLIVVGKFSSYNGQAVSSHVIRLNADGTIDNTFNPVIKFNDFGDTKKAYVQPDGKILVTGPMITIGGADDFERLIRLNADGTRDQTFQAENNFSGINSLAFQSDGKFIMAGTFTTVGTTTVNRIARFNTNGTLDNTFNTGTGFDAVIYEVKVTSTGRVLVAGSFTTFNGTAMKYLVALTSTGSVDGAFTQNGTPNAPVQGLALQSDGKILIAGQLSSLNGTAVNKLARLQVNGAVDATFATNIGTGPNSGTFLTFATVNAEDDILILGYSSFTAFNGQSRSSIALLESTGVLKGTSAALTLEAAASVDKIVRQGSQILVAHSGTMANGLVSPGFERMNADGTLDATFRSGLQVDDNVLAIFIDANGNIIIGGNFTTYKGVSAGRIARLNASGTIDNTFRTNTGTGFNSLVYAIAQQGDGKLIVGGSFGAFNGVTRRNLVRLNTDGTIDNTFNAANGFTGGVVREIKIQSDGKILVGGEFTSFAGNTIKSLVRLNIDGTLDNTFAIGTGFEREAGAASGIYAIHVIDNGQILVGGSFDRVNGSNAGQYYVRLNSNGTLDTRLSGTGFFIVDTFFKLDNGKILIAEREYGLSLLNSDGTVDPSFTPVPLNGISSSITTVGDNIYWGGTMSLVDGVPVSGIAKVKMPAPPVKPSNVNFTVANMNQVNISWADNATDETGYEVDRSVGNNQSYTRIATLAANTTQYADNTTEADKTYYYRVRAKGRNTYYYSDYTADRAVAYGEGGTWMLKQEFSGPARTDAVAFGLGQKGYVGTGLTGAYALDMRAYDPSTDTWTTAAAFGGSIRAEALSFVIGTKAYVGLGEDGFGPDKKKDLWEYNDQTNAWTQRADFPGTIRRNAIAFVVNGKAYVGGGIDDTGRKNDFYEYDPATNTWSSVAAFPGEAREGAVAFSIGGDGYVGTGRTAAGRTKDLWKYTAATNTWTRVADFPGLAREEAVAFVIDGKAYVGTGDSGKDEKDFYRYDAATDAWTKVVSFGGSARAYATSFTVGTKGYVATGFDGSNLKDVWEFAAMTIQPTPSAPSALTATTVSSTTIDLSWTDNTTNETGFVLERSKTDESNYTVIATLNANIVSYSDNSLTANTRYYYRIKAITAAAGASPYAAAVNATTLNVPPQAPTNLAATAISHTQIRLTWTDLVTNEAQFVIERAPTETGDFVEVGTVQANVTSFYNNDLASTTTYFYRVKAKNNGGSSAYTATASATTLVSPVAAPSNLTATALIGPPMKVRLEWIDNADNETGFHLQRAVKGTENYFVIATLAANTTSYDDATITEAASYTYRVRSLKGADYSSFTAPVSVTTPRTIPSAPSQLTAVLDENMTIAHLQWVRNSSNEDGFVIERSINGGPFTELATVTTLVYEDKDLTKSLTVSYRVYAYNTSGKSAASNTASLVTTGIEEDAWHHTLAIYPNPVKDALTIEISNAYRGDVQFSWYNLQGQVIKSYTKTKTTQTESYVVNAREFNAGVLMLKVTMGNRTMTRKVVVQ
ncbi:fibronectin type III domain-containing protein [Fulvivirgaceae bacterium PWU4]|uniref:Fibronectin type III domain-containing protein n=1 Tax=Chryseosolibacter histidini TaxID=2782349 RepID=A0AAP2DK64_9BACT|nr:fibronectin type III domain-containing protein [Chryseosolibacter histidini]MBT1696853.1 fibronectin type III domain-containing protein [Chryseosolibacter histidini]